MNGWECQNCKTVWFQRRCPFECEICRHRRNVQPSWRHIKDPGPPPTKQRKRGSMTPSRRNFVFARDGFRCRECGETNRKLLSVDHIRPRSKGGDNQVENLQTLCKPCNNAKGDAIPPEYPSQRKMRELGWLAS